MRITNISDAKANLSRLIELVQNSDKPIVIGKAGKPIAVLSAYKSDSTPRKLGGSWEGKVKFTDDFDSTPDEWMDAFYEPSTLLKEKKIP